MRLACHVARGDDAPARIAAALAARAAPPSLAIVLYGARWPQAAVAEALRGGLGGAPAIGGTSCRGVLSAGGPPDPSDIGLLLIEDERGDYGAGIAPLGGDPAEAAARALEAALEACGCAGELPAAVWVYQPPGSEERVLEGLRGALGDGCPILGGSSADDDVTGGWSQLGPQAVEGPAVAVAALFPSSPVAATFQSGYAPTGLGGTVTEAAGRTIRAIDGRPAAEALNGWLEGALSASLGGGGVLAETSLTPLGAPMRDIEGVTLHRLIHPARLSAEGWIETFAETPEGTEIALMRGGAEALARRGGLALDDAIGLLPHPDRFAGALMIYCGGCMMAVGDRLDLLADGVARAARGRPVLGAFTFGEQGPMGGACVHGNLMVSALAFEG